MFTQGSNTQQQILDQVEQAISSNKAGNLDISGYKNTIDFLNKSWSSFKQNAIDSVTQVGESSQSIVKNLWDFGNKMLNQESASGSGVGIKAAVQESVQNLFLKPHDGAGGIHRTDLAGAVPFERRRQ